jgi:cytochrome c
MRRSDLLLAATLLLAACGSQSRERAAAELTGGEPRRGAAAVAKYGCGSCHTAKGVSGASGQVATEFRDVHKRTYIAGVIANTPENLMRWIQDPKVIDEKTAMPNLGVTPSDAADIAAYIYSLK